MFDVSDTVWEIRYTYIKGLNLSCVEENNSTLIVFDKGENVTSIFTFSYNVFNTLSPFGLFNPLPDDKILDWSNFKQTADDISKCI